MRNKRFNMPLSSSFLIAAIAAWFIGTFAFWSRTLIYSDGYQYSHFVNLFLGSVQRFSYPLWDPFNFWGRPEGVMARAVSEMNPLYLVVIFLQKIGFSFLPSYMFFLFLYCVLGALGFYYILRHLYRDKLTAYVGFCLYLFSTLSHNVFNDLQIVLISTNIIWFFCSCLQFQRHSSVRNWLQVVFWVMINLITYIPFAFIFICFFYSIFSVIFIPREFLSFLSQAVKFLQTKKIILLLSILLLLLALMPSLMQISFMKSGEYTWQGRSSISANRDVINVGIEDANRSAVNTIFCHNFRNFFSNIRYLQLYNLFLPSISFIILAIGLWMKLNRRLWLFAAMSLIIFFVSIADGSGVYKFLYEHLFFMRYFRNVHLFFWAALPFFILFLVDIFNQFYAWSRNTIKNKFWALAYVILCHVILGVYFFIASDGSVLWILFGLVVSMLFFIIFLSKTCRKLWVKKALFLLVIVSQTLPAFFFIQKNSSSGPKAKDFLNSLNKPKFEYLRPGYNTPWERKDSAGFGLLKDASGFDIKRGSFIGSSRVLKLWSNVGAEALKEYAKYKFVLYDNVKVVNNVDYSDLKKCLSERCGQALIESEKRPFFMSLLGKFSPAQFIEKASPEFNVLDFDLNHIIFETNFTHGRFLVYNDSYHSQWKVYIDGKLEEIYLANGAFKGIFVPEGHHKTKFYFRPFAQSIYFSILMVFYLMGILLFVTHINYKIRKNKILR